MQNASNLSGDLSFIGFPDLLQLLGANAASGELVLEDSFGVSVKVIMKDGEIFNAIFKDKEGEDAFFIPFAWTGGKFSFSMGNISCERKIDNNLTGLILEGLRLFDEGKIMIDNFSDLPYKKGLPVLRGQFIDYSELVDEEFFEKDELIVKEGRYGSWIWVILDGLVQVEKQVHGKFIPVMHLGRGGFIGSVAAFSRGDRPRSATVKALSRVHLGVLDAQSLSKEYTAYSDLLRKYLACMDERLRKITDAFSDSYINGKKNVIPRESLSGIIREKLKGKRLGIIESGRGMLLFESKGKFLPVGELHEGELIGELPFINKAGEFDFFIKGDENFAIRPFEQSLLGDEFLKVSENMRKMVEFAGQTISVTAYNLGRMINS